MDTFIFLFLTTFATYRIFILVSQDKITEKLRNKIFDKFGDPSESWTYVFTCPWCFPLWVLPFMVLLYAFAFTAWYYICAVLTVSFFIGFLEERR